MGRMRAAGIAVMIGGVFVLAAWAFRSEEGRRLAGAALVVGALVLVATDQVSRHR